MKIRELILKNYGKLSGCDIALQDGINILYGENESGKTTIHSFLKGMFFGMERGRGRASANDMFSRYEPWENPNYYEGVLRFESGGKCFRLERKFDRYNKSVSLLCEDDGEVLSPEQGDLEVLLGGMTAAGYDNTIAVGQLKVETTSSLATELKNYATNYYAAGSGEIDLTRALNVLREKKKGIEKEYQEIVKQKEEKREQALQESEYIWRDIHKLEQSLEVLEKDIQISEMEQKKDQKGGHRWKLHPVEIISMILSIVLSVVLFEAPINYCVVMVVASAELLYCWNQLKDRDRKKKGAKEKQTKEKKAEALAKLRWEQEHVRTELREKQVQYDNILEYLDELNEMGSEYKKQEMHRKALELATSRLIELSENMQKRVSDELNRKASEVLAAVTAGKYERLLVDENLNISLCTAGRNISVERLSRGTLEQAFFALRMAACDILYEEEYPVILDDAFAFYDDERLAGVLRWLSEHKKQVIILTCQKREMQALDELGIPYAKIEW